MPIVAVYNIQGEQTGEIQLHEKVFGIEPNEAVVHEAVVQQLAGLRQGTHSTKTRAEVRGGGRKPWRQKGTGRARAGTIRSPIWRKGGITFGPKPRDYSYTIPKKKRSLALRSALSSKVLGKNLIVLEQLSFSEPKTKEMLKVLEALHIEQKALIVTTAQGSFVKESARNIPGVKPLTVSGVNVYDLIKYTKLILTKEAVAEIEEVLA